MVSLFERGLFKLHSGGQSDWRINSEALTWDDLDTIAFWLSDRIGRYGLVVGIPEGGRRLAECFRRYSTSGPLLIVDDVLTTGASMEAERARHSQEVIGAVWVARGPCPQWVTPMFILDGSQEEEPQMGESNEREAN